MSSEVLIGERERVQKCYKRLIIRCLTWGSAPGAGSSAPRYDHHHLGKSTRAATDPQTGIRQLAGTRVVVEDT
jgi:hypothetical protein